MASASTAVRAPEGALHGASIIRELKASRIEFVVSVPDITTSEGLLRPLARSAASRSNMRCPSA
jgi:sulfopyruvate decarboxylase subunit alpha